jgi:hypothetical protein
VGSRAGLDDVVRRNFSPLPGLELQPLARSARSQSLYPLSYSDFTNSNNNNNNNNSGCDIDTGYNFTDTDDGFFVT